MKFRSFLAFDIPDVVRTELASAIEFMAQKVKGVSWIDPQRLHCTVKFFGDVEEEFLLGKVAEVIAEELEGHVPMKLTATGIGVFPNWRYPRVIWAGLTGETESALMLYDGLAKVFEPLGLPRDQRAFRLHLTLGRAKSRLNKTEALVTFIEKQVTRDFGDVLVDRLTLYRSVLTRKGSVYTPLRQFFLGGSSLKGITT